MATKVFKGHFAGNISPEILSSKQYSLIFDCALGTEKIQSRFHALQLSSAANGKPQGYIPVRFVHAEKIDKHEKLQLAFDALVISMVLGDIPPFGRIIHGGEYKASKIDLSELIISARTIVQNISAQLSSETAPELILNDHCSSCGFKARCRQTAVEKDDLSLLSRITEKERKKLRSQGLFSVTQLSYTFRPRRRPKRFAGLTKKHNLPLQALAIRERKVHVDGKPDFALSGTPVYLDVESIPDRQFYYLIGLRILHSGNMIQHSFWAEDPLQEREIWASFLKTLSTLPAPQLIHYGSHEKLFLKRMNERYGIRNSRIVKPIIERPVNLLSVIFGSLYFPTYSNGLKDIARYLGFEWSDADVSGLQSLHWRVEWEFSRDDNLKKRLIRYNAEDCEALERVTHAVARLCEPSPQREPSAHESDDVVDVSLQRTYPQRFGTVDFIFPELESINKAAYWDYQRSRLRKNRATSQEEREK